ncbi:MULTISPECIES: hypothetical protein [unclassified Roseibium]|uniref:hypothetical protein n=1 Tax=unclassified Roseibium TaxID=2629323 RepID=UPI00273CFCEF|nr:MULTISPECIES: hypothetical protein [unclassified Roseibium]
MNLDEFVKRSLLAVTKGVVDAQEESLLFIAPGHINGKRIEKAHEVKFEVSVTVSAEGGGGIQVLSFGELKAGAKTESTNKLTFEVPVYFNAPTPHNASHFTNKKSEET